LQTSKKGTFMLKKLISAALMLITATAFAAVDVNKASQAELEAIKGVGPGISTKILDERKKGPFKDWNNMIERVPGVGEGNAAKFSADGLTVNGGAFAGAPAAVKPVAAAAKEKTIQNTAMKAEDKKTAVTAMPTAAAPASKATDGKKMSNAEAKKSAKEERAITAASPASNAKK
jgi:competence protein ComEA